MGSRGARARALAGAVVVAALLTGCAGEVVAGQGVPDWSYADERARDLLRVQVVAAGAALETSSPFTSTAQPDVTGVGYVHAAYGDRDTGSRSVVSVLGNPASVLIQQTDADAGYTIDTLHVGGQAVDHLLLGASYASLAPTPWVQVPTVFGDPGEDDLTSGLRTLCFVDGFQQMCEIHDAIVLTQDSERGARARAVVDLQDDGTVHVTTEVTLASVLANDAFLGMPPELVAEIPDEMLDAFIPVIMWQDATGMPMKMELNGTVPGTGGAQDLVVQAGFEIAGTAAAADFPAPPGPWDTTVITEPDAVTAFYDALGSM